MPRQKKASPPAKDTTSYRHPEADLAARPEIGAQAHFKKSKAPATYRFDSSLSPELSWDGQNAAREQGEALLRAIAEAKTLDEARAAAAQLAAIAKPFLNWAGKAERLSFDVPTLPLFVHERLSTKVILESLEGHKRDRQIDFLDALFGASEQSLTDQVLRAYEHRDQWVNRMILGDSLVVMNSLLNYESLGGQAQMIYMDPPYGVKFGSNFQPFIRKRDVKHNEDNDLTREPEMVQAYRDTWELGLHSYLTYLRDRLLLCRELLAPTGSVFVQISDENLHHVRELMDEVFGANNFIAVIPFRKKTMPLGTTFIEQMSDFLLWYAEEAYDSNGKRKATYQRLYSARSVEGEFHHCWYELPDGSRQRMSKAQLFDHALLPPGARVYRLKSLEPSGPMSSGQYDYKFEGVTYKPPRNGWGTPPGGMDRLVAARRIQPEGNRLTFIMYADEGTATQVTAPWTDTVGADDKAYAVQTHTEVVRRCLMMTTRPGDLVLDPTCGSGTTAFVAEQWGRRWITVDTSRVPLALARQRLLSAAFDYYELQDDTRGPASGFVYLPGGESKNPKSIGPGIVPHITLGSIANNEPPAEEVLVDRPEVKKGIVRVTGPFTVEATIPTSAGLDDEPETPGIQSEDHRTHVARMIEVLRHAPTVRLPGNQTVALKHIRPPAKTLALSAEALVGGSAGGEGEPVAILFGPADGPISERLVREAWDEAGLKHYARLLVIGFGIDPKAREFVDKAGQIGIPCLYLQATMDLQMGDLLKNMRSSQVFSVCGLPDIEVRRKRAAKGASQAEAARWEVELLGLDTFDPATMEPTHVAGNEVPAWLLDTDYNGMVFRVRQAFFPRTGAWESLKKSLKVEFDETVWEHLAGTVSAPFEAGEHRQVAVKVIDPRGNELIVVRKIEVER
jgi:adenine-specific DNA-methyltransferase